MRSTAGNLAPYESRRASRDAADAGCALSHNASSSAGTPHETGRRSGRVGALGRRGTEGARRVRGGDRDRGGPSRQNRRSSARHRGSSRELEAAPGASDCARAPQAGQRARSHAPIRSDSAEAGRESASSLQNTQIAAAFRAYSMNHARVLRAPWGQVALAGVSPAFLRRRWMSFRTRPGCERETCGGGEKNGVLPRVFRPRNTIQICLWQNQFDGIAN